MAFDDNDVVINITGNNSEFKAVAQDTQSLLTDLRATAINGQSQTMLNDLRASATDLNSTSSAASLPKQVETLKKADNALSSIRTQFRSMGREISMVGMTMTATFTLPIVAAVTAMVKSGVDASKQVADARTKLTEAIAGGDKTKIAEATAEWNALTPAVKDTAAAYDAMTAAIQPAKTELANVSAELMAALVPVVQQLAPLLLQLVDGVKQAADWFSKLPIGTKDAIVGIVALVAALGPAVVIIGKGAELIGAFAGIAEHLGVVLPIASTGVKEFAASTYAALGPVGALALALLALYEVWQKFGRQAQTTVNQAADLLAYGLTGDKQMMKTAISQPEVPVLGYTPKGNVFDQSTPQMPANSFPGVFPRGGATGQPITVVVNNNGVSLGNQDEANNVLIPMIVNALHALGVRQSG